MLRRFLRSGQVKSLFQIKDLFESDTQDGLKDPGLMAALRVLWIQAVPDELVITNDGLVAAGKFHRARDLATTTPLKQV